MYSFSTPTATCARRFRIWDSIFEVPRHRRQSAGRIENATQFLGSLAIFAGRLPAYLKTYRPDSWVDVPSYELFLDTQSLFLFAQQASVLPTSPRMYGERTS
jgi:hypothetical protein